MTLIDAVRELDFLNGDATIYATEPWTLTSMVVIAHEPAAGGVPVEAHAHGMKYFLEVFVARDFVKDWAASVAQEPSLAEKCERLIHFAIYDA